MNRLRELRQERGLTILQVSLKTGLSEGWIQKAETNSPSITFTLNAIEKLCNLYKVSSDYLLGFGKDKDNLSNNEIYKKVDDLKMQVNSLKQFIVPTIEAQIKSIESSINEVIGTDYANRQ